MDPTTDELAALRAQHEALLLGLNHELRTPLTVIQNFAQLLASGELDDHQRRCLEGITEGIQRAQAVVDQLVDASTHVGGTHVPKPSNS